MVYNEILPYYFSNTGRIKNISKLDRYVRVAPDANEISQWDCRTKSETLKRGKRFKVSFVQ